jgi:hypothetical protein
MVPDLAELDLAADCADWCPFAPCHSATQPDSGSDAEPFAPVILSVLSVILSEAKNLNRR